MIIRNIILKLKLILSRISITLRVTISKELAELTNPMICETIKEATANAKSMDTMGPMLLWLCKISLNFFLLEYAANTPSVA